MRYWQASWQTGKVIKESLDSQSSIGFKQVFANLWARSSVLTLIISLICVGVYLVFAAVGRPVFEALNYPQDIKHTQEYWRLLTPVFIHLILLIYYLT
ncbi:MAG: hypothetical protein U1E99_00035 [Agitococcus sp.]